MVRQGVIEHPQDLNTMSHATPTLFILTPDQAHAVCTLLQLKESAVTAPNSKHRNRLRGYVSIQPIPAVHHLTPPHLCNSNHYSSTALKDRLP